MLTSEDKKFLTENFATKDDIKLLATKKEFVGLEGNVAGLQKDVTGLQNNVAGLQKDVTELKVESSLMQQNMQRMEQRMERTEGKIDKVLTMLDGFTGKVAGLDQENKFGAVILNRHDIQIHELATATGTNISE